jgi:hypothetical protein
MREDKHSKDHTPGYSADFDPEQNLGVLRGEIELLRDSAHAAAGRPDFFWKRQHNKIMASLKKPVPTAKQRPALLWAPVALGVVLCILFFVQSSKAPTPDFAAGSDQDLLIGIERALSRQYPEAFDPAIVIVPDKVIEKNRSGRK